MVIIIINYYYYYCYCYSTLPDTTSLLDECDAEFRTKVEKIRQMGGDAWLTMLGEMQNVDAVSLRVRRTQTGRQSGTQTDRQTGRHTDRHTDGQTNGQKGRHTDRKADRQTDR